MESESNQFSVSFDGQNSSVAVFPVKDDILIATTSEHDVSDDLDWLENKSFVPAAVLLAEEKISFVPEPSSSQQSSFARLSTGIGDGNVLDDKYPQKPKKALKRPVPENDKEAILAEKAFKIWKEKKEENHKQKKDKKKKHKKKKDKEYQDKQTNHSYSSRNMRERKDDFSKSGNDVSKTFVEEIPGLQPDCAFRLDPTAEKSLWNYESVCKNKIAKYFCVTQHCLGNKNISLHQQNKRRRRSPCRYFTKDSRKEIQEKGIFVTDIKHLQNETTQYIAIDKEDGKHEQTNQVEDGTTFLGLSHAGTMHSHRKQVAIISGDEQHIDETVEKTAYYNRQLHEDPNNIKLWMEFVDFQNQIFQDAMFSPKSMVNRKLQDSSRSLLVCIEKQLSILDKALEANPSSLELKIKKLEVQQSVTDSSALTKEWDKLLFVNSADVKLWRQFLLFNQSASFTVGHIIQLYHRCFSTLNPFLQGQVKVVKQADNLEEDIIGVFEQYCSFLLQTGFTEKAVSSYQALIEFNLFRPSSLNLTSTADCVAAFESFWNSGVARFGENGARGWVAWVTNPALQDSDLLSFCGMDVEQEQILAQDMDLLHTWLGIEQLRQSTHWQSWRPNFSKGETEEDCEDPDRLVLFEDVAPVLFCLSQSASCYRLVIQFVQLLGLAQQQRGEYHTAEFDQLLLTTLQQVPAAHGMNTGVTLGFLWQPNAKMLQFLEEVLHQAAHFFTGWYHTYFTFQLLQLQVHKLGILDVTSITAKQSKEIRKFGKDLLKETQNRNDLLLWDKYIRLEWALGRNKDAMSMLQTALTMFTSSISRNDHAGMAGLCSLYRTSAEICLNFTPTELVRLTGRKASPSSDCKNNVVTSFICLMDTAKLSAGNSQNATAGQILITRKKFLTVLKGLIGNTTNLSDPFVKTHIVQCVICFALFELCAAGFGESVEVFDSTLQLCSLTSQTANSQIRIAVEDIETDLTQSLLSFLTNCMSVQAVSLVQIRSHLDTSLTRFPDNPTLLRYLVDLESKSCLARRLRHYFQAATREPSSVYPVLFEILSEMSRYVKLMAASMVSTHTEGETIAVENFGDTGIVHRVRSACERALQHKVAQHCPLIWRLYFHFEAKHGNIGKAEGVLYRALQSCPWAKMLYIDGIELFGTKHFQELVDLMTEKELRIQIPLEEVEFLIQSESPDTADAQHDVHVTADDKQSDQQDTADNTT